MIDSRSGVLGRMPGRAAAGSGSAAFRIASALAALRRAYLAAVAEHSPVIGFSGPAFARMITDSPALTARLREFHDEREKALADALTEEAGTGPGDILPRVAAALLGGVHRLLFDETLHRTLGGQDDAEIAAALTAHIGTAFDALEPALGGYAVRPGVTDTGGPGAGRQ